ncbi:phage terminase large subunit [Bacillus sp. FJAT-50079]|uniref:phage terminase large subunit n=1 Tax=Bacillus sp. FJAT-50079 TaxID=2833577 RepID=UPI001BC99459|nr:phage terminase large subunit [Bacillus sp. FJAT-50079]MBS4207455.1 phage terminase large subunit [Bacillus sp. FJAT-50079]
MSFKKLNRKEEATIKEQDLKLLMKYLEKHFTSEEIETLINNYPLTGQDGLRKMLAEINISYLAQAYFPKYFNKPFSQFHTSLMKELNWLIENEGKRMVVGVPRGFGKSTLSSFLFPLHILLYKKLQFILLVSATEDIAVPFLQMIKDELTSNDAIIEDFGKLKSSSKWAFNEIWLNNDTCMMIRGIDGSIRGVRYKEHRPSLILADDLIKDDVAESDSAREKLANTYKDSLLNAGDENTRTLVVGTVLHQEDILSELLSPETTGYKQLFFQSVLNWAERSDLWAEWRKLYTSLEDKNREQTAHDFFIAHKDEMLEGARVLWEEKFNYYHLMKKLVDDGESSFYKEMMCQPRGAEDYIFNNIKYFDSLPDLNECNSVMFVDPAMGKRNGDYSAITILSKHKITGYKYVVNGEIRRITPDKLIDLIVEKVKQYEDFIDVLAFESVLFQEYILEDLKKRLKIEGIFHIRIKPVKPRTKKEVRIMQLQPDIANGIIKFNRDSQEYNSQVKDWNPKASHDDAPDSLTGAWELIEKVKKPKQVRPKPSWL